MAHMTNDVNAVRQATGMAVVALVDALFITPAVLAIMLGTNVRLTLLSIAPLPVLTVGVVFFGRVVGERFKRVQEGFSNMSDVVAGVHLGRARAQDLRAGGGIRPALRSRATTSTPGATCRWCAPSAPSTPR